MRIGRIVFSKLPSSERNRRCTNLIEQKIVGARGARLGARFLALAELRFEAANLVANPSFKSPTYWSGAGNKMCCSFGAVHGGIG